MKIRLSGLWAAGFVCLAVVSVHAQVGPTFLMNCDQGQSLNRTLTRLNKAVPVTVLNRQCNQRAVR